MNPTIEKIVTLLFEDVAETDETRALCDEMLINCQERYEDLLENGLSEDEAIHAVLESLNGMEEVLSQYPKKQHAQETDAQLGAQTCFNPAQDAIHTIDIQLGSDDLELSPSNDDLLHVDTEDGTPATARLDGGTLRIERQRQGGTNANADADDPSIDLGKALRQLVQLGISIFTSATIHVQIPGELCPKLSISATSGDISGERLRLESLSIGAVSGDIDLEDVSVNGTIKLNTTSGDVDWTGECAELEAATMSGDLDLDGLTASAIVKTVSGDADVTVRGAALTRLAAKSTSGDVHVSLPGISSAEIRCHTVSGDVRQRLSSVPGCGVMVELSSVSGDISVR